VAGGSIAHAKTPTNARNKRNFISLFSFVVFTSFFPNIEGPRPGKGFCFVIKVEKKLGDDLLDTSFHLL
jgi:hypothetical protein